MPVAHAQSSPSGLPATVPRYVLDAVRLSIADFAFALAEARVSAGFVAFAREFDWDPAFRSTRPVWNAVAEVPTDAPAVPLAQVIETFVARYPA